MRILFFTRKLNIGGCQINAINLGKALAQREHAIFIAAEPGVLVEQACLSGLEFIPIQYSKFKHPSVQFMQKLAGLVNEYQIDILQAFDSIPTLEAYGSQFWHKQPVYGIITAQAMPVFRLPRTREIGLVNPDTFNRYVSQLNWPPEKLRLIVARLDCERYQPLEINKEEILKEYGLEADYPAILLVSRIDAGKWPSIQLFLSAARHWHMTRAERFPVQFAIMGGGTLLEKLKREADKINAETGHRSIYATGEKLDVPKMMNASTVVIGMASSCQQGMACGKPVIVMGNKGFSSIVSPESFEKLANCHFNVHEESKEGQPESLCQQIESLISAPERMQFLGAFGRERACEIFDSRLGAKQLEVIYTKLLTQNKSPLIEELIFWEDFSRSLYSLYMYKLHRILQVK